MRPRSRSCCSGAGTRSRSSRPPTARPRSRRTRCTGRRARCRRGVRHARAVQLIAAAARRADVVYSTGMLGRSALGSALVHAPIVQKLTSDPTYERSIRYGLYGGDLDSFQRGGRLARAHAAHGAQPRAAARLAHPDPERVARAGSRRRGGSGRSGSRCCRTRSSGRPALEERDELRRRHGLDGPTLVFAGRLSVQKAVDVALEALTRLDGLDLVARGRRARRREAACAGGRARARRARALPRPAAAVDASSSSCAPATRSCSPRSGRTSRTSLVEALAVGTPVIATRRAA